jgi:hypothetical protein
MGTLHEVAECRWELEGNTSAERGKLLSYTKQIEVVGISGLRMRCPFPRLLNWTWLKLKKGFESFVVLPKHYFLLVGCNTV